MFNLKKIATFVLSALFFMSGILYAENNSKTPTFVVIPKTVGLPYWTEVGFGVVDAVARQLLASGEAMRTYSAVAERSPIDDSRAATIID